MPSTPPNLTSTGASPGVRRGGAHGLADALRRRETGVALMLVAMVAGVWGVNPAFLAPASVADMLAGCAPAAIVVCGIAMVLVAGEIDVSVGSLYGFLAALMGVLASPERGAWPALPTGAAVIAAGLLAGLVNGALVGFARLPSIIVTLGTMAVLRGGAELLLRGAFVDLPSSLRALGTGTILGLGFPVWIAAAVVCIAAVVARCSRFGVRLYAVGGNAGAAGHAGIRAGVVKLGAFTITGGLVGVAALVTVPQLPKIEPGLGLGLELLTISAAVVGGVSVRGGVGTIAGAAIATLLLGTVRSGLVFLKLGPEGDYWERTIHGAFILGAVALDHATRAAPERGGENTELGPWRRATVLHGAMLGLALCVVVGAASRMAPGFGGAQTQGTLLSQASEIALLAAPVALIMLTGGIDLSVGSIMALAAVAAGLLYERGVDARVACGVAVLVGAACGMLNGVLVARVKMHPLIVTLATMALFRGLAEGLSGGRPVSGFPSYLTDLGTRAMGPVPLVLLPAAAALVVAWAMLRYTVAGWMVRAIGFNETACRYGALAVDRLKLWLYTFSGACAGVAAVLLIMRRNTAKADAGMGIELDVITAVVLGGVSVSGGRGSIAGVALGVLLLHELRQFIGWRWQSDEVVPLVIGGVLIAATVAGTVKLKAKSAKRISGGAAA